MQNIINISDITVGTKITHGNQTMVVTGTTKHGFVGFIEYKGKQHETHMFFSTLTNPHYSKGIIIEN